jgi:transposase-like protein
MSSAKKMHYSNAIKFKVALEAIKSGKTIAEISTEHNVPSSLVSKWKKHVLDSGANIFSSPTQSSTSSHVNKDSQLYEQLGRQAVEITYLKKLADRYL